MMPRKRKFTLKPYAVAVVLFAFGAGVTIGKARANTVDISSIKCSDLATYKTEYISFLLIWIDGYLGGRAEDTNFDAERMGNNAEKAIKLCASNQDKGLVTIFKEAEMGQ
jgi:hypothetical protein